MFRRRHKLHPLQSVREYVWPRSGWRRASLYLVHRLSRLPESPFNIAAGFACGAAISMTPFVGFHFAIAALIAWLMGANILAAAVGTAIGNPWTFPFIWYWIYHFGDWIMGGGGGAVPEQLTLGLIWDHPGRILLPMTVGSVPTAIMTWGIAYWPVCELIERYQARRRRRLGGEALGPEPRGGDRRQWKRRAEDRETVERRVDERRVAQRRATDEAIPGSAAPGNAAPGSAAPGSAAPGSAGDDPAAPAERPTGESVENSAKERPPGRKAETP